MVIVHIYMRLWFRLLIIYEIMSLSFFLVNYWWWKMLPLVRVCSKSSLLRFFTLSVQNLVIERHEMVKMHCRQDIAHAHKPSSGTEMVIWPMEWQHWIHLPPVQHLDTYSRHVGAGDCKGHLGFQRARFVPFPTHPQRSKWMKLNKEDFAQRR